MIDFHAVLLDETGCEFGADTQAPDRGMAYSYFKENYPESRVVQLESAEDAAQREAAMYAHIARGGDWDEDGHPIYHYDYDDDFEADMTEEMLDDEEDYDDY